MAEPSSQTPSEGGPPSEDDGRAADSDPSLERQVASWFPWPDLDERWFIYPAYLLAIGGGLTAANFSLGRQEWSVVPVILGWGLLFIWYWLYGVAYRYRRPALKYLSLATAVGFGGLLTAFCLDRALPQLAATQEGLATRSASLTLAWAAFATGISVAAIVLHAILFSRFRGS